MKPIIQAFGWVDEIVSIVSLSEEKLRGERTDIENGLTAQVDKFQKELEDVKNDVLQFKDNNQTKKTKDYITKIETINTRLKALA